MNEFMEEYEESSLYTYRIIITHVTYEERYYIEKKQGLKNTKEITIGEFEELYTFLSKALINQYNEEDHLKEFRTGRRATRVKYEYLITKREVYDRYLEREYREVLEDTYKGTLVYYHTKGIVERIEYSDNNDTRELGITFDTANKITEKFLKTDQNLTVRYIGSPIKEPIEATETSKEIIRILEEEERLIRKQLLENENTEQYINQDSNMQEQSYANKEESDDSEDSEKGESNKEKIRDTTNGTSDSE
jgi:hypothetical protein